MEDKPNSGRTCTSQTEENVTKVRALVRSDRRLIVRMISSELNLNHHTVHDILSQGSEHAENLCKAVSKNFTDDEKENRRNVCLELLEHIENDETFFKSVVTGDESWIFKYDPETKRQSSGWHTNN